MLLVGIAIIWILVPPIQRAVELEAGHAHSRCSEILGFDEVGYA